MASYYPSSTEKRSSPAWKLMYLIATWLRTGPGFRRTDNIIPSDWYTSSMATRVPVLKSTVEYVGKRRQLVVNTPSTNTHSSNGRFDEFWERFVGKFLRKNVRLSVYNFNSTADPLTTHGPYGPVAPFSA